MMPISSCLLCFFVLSILSIAYGELRIHRFDSEIYYVGIKNVMSFTASEYPATELSRDGIELLTIHAGTQSSQNCTVDRVFAYAKMAKFTCVFSYDAFTEPATTLSTHLVIQTKNGVTYTTAVNNDLELVSSTSIAFEVKPRFLVLKSGVQFTVDLKKKPMLDMSLLRADLSGKEQKLVSYQSGMFVVELMTDFQDTDPESVKQSIYHAQDKNKVFIHNVRLGVERIIFPTTDKYLRGLDNLVTLSVDDTVKIVGSFVEEVKTVKLHNNDGDVVGALDVQEQTPTSLVVNNDALLADPLVYITVEGHEGQVVVLVTEKDYIFREIFPSACEELYTCTLAIVPALPNNLPYRITVENLERETVVLEYMEISTKPADSVIYIKKFPRNINSLITFEINGVAFARSVFKLMSVPHDDLLFTNALPNPVPLSRYSIQPRVSVYGAGFDQIPQTMDFLFTTYAGNRRVLLKMQRDHDVNGIAIYQAKLPEDQCLPAYTCYKEMNQVSPMTTMTHGHFASLYFRPVAATNSFHRIYFETSLTHLDNTGLLRIIKEFENFSVDCVNVHFSIFQTVPSIGGTWIDVSLTNSNVLCYEAVLYALEIPNKKFHEALRVTGRSIGGHTQQECKQQKPIVFRKDCREVDTNPYEPMLTPTPHSPHRPGGNHSTIIIVCSVIGAVLILFGILYYWKCRNFRISDLLEDEVDVYESIN